MWKKLTTSKQATLQSNFAEKMKVDNGLLRLDPKTGGSPNFVTEDRLRAIQPQLELWVDMCCAYPDKFIELIVPPETQFKLYPFQILTLRSCMRYKRFSLTCTRGVAVWSKPSPKEMPQHVLSALPAG